MLSDTYHVRKRVLVVLCQNLGSGWDIKTYAASPPLFLLPCRDVTFFSKKEMRYWHERLLLKQWRESVMCVELPFSWEYFTTCSLWAAFATARANCDVWTHPAARSRLLHTDNSPRVHNTKRRPSSSSPSLFPVIQEHSLLSPKRIGVHRMGVCSEVCY